MTVVKNHETSMHVDEGQKIILITSMWISIKPSGVLNYCLHVPKFSSLSKPTILLWKV
jgi:hypothetical protein